jgi:putative DNA methylase
VVFAHKTTEGWEALLSGMIKEGWVITSSWPIATERPGRLRSQDSAALATSVHLVCRPRDAAAPVGDWAEVARELPGRVRTWMDRLVAEGVRGADLVFACIGPAMEIYSRYSRVVDAQDREIPLGGDPTASDPCTQGYLAKVWEVVGRIALEQVLGDSRGGATAFEEDARLTALFLWAIQGSADESTEPSLASAEESLPDESETGSTTRGYTLVYDVVRRFAQPLGIHLESWEGRIIETEGGIVRLLALTERIPQLFEEEDVQKLALEPEESSHSRQMTLFPEQEVSPHEKGSPTPKGRRGARAGVVQAGSELRRRTTLDRLHTAMLLQAHGASVPLRTLLKEEKKHGPEFERLARSMTALYPQGSEERRLLEALALAIPD